MRKTPRPAPTIDIEPEETVIEDYGSIKEAPLACFSWDKRNAVTILNMSHYNSDDECIDMINHEINHWAQFMFLTNREVLRLMRKYMRVHSMGRCPFIEWINPIKSGLDFEEWEEKYNRPFMDLSIIKQ